MKAKAGLKKQAQSRTTKIQENN